MSGTHEQQLLPLARIKALPADRDGRAGENRYRGTSKRYIRADDDLQALTAFVDNYRDNALTQAAYEREATRLLLWAVHERKRALSSLDAEDLAAYFAFLKKLPAHWIARARPAAKETRLRREDWQWRPYRRKPGAAAIAQSRRVVSVLMGWLTKVRYLAGNPMAAVAKPRGRDKPRIERFIRQEAWAWLMRWLAERTREANPQRIEDCRWVRAQYTVMLAYLTGLRAAEIARARMGGLTRMSQEDGWWLSVERKGGVQGRVPVTDELIDAIGAYRRWSGLEAIPQPGEATPLVMRLKGERGGSQPLTANSIYLIIKSVMLEASAAARTHGEKEFAANFAAASTHWLRHTHATHFMDAGGDVRAAQANLDHADLRSTSIYQHTEDRKRHQEVNRALRAVRANSAGGAAGTRDGAA